MITWAAGMHFAYSARAWCGLFASLTDGRVLLRHEITWLRVAPEDARVDFIAQINAVGIGLPRDAEARGLQPLRYVVAQAGIFPKEKRSGSGETISETFSRVGIPMRCADMDEINGWNRLRSWLRTRDHEDKSTNPPTKFSGPSLVVHPDCKYFLRTFPTLVSDAVDPDVIVATTDAYPAFGARYYVMSRPAPASKQPTPPPPKHSIYYDVDKIRRATNRPRLGADNVI